MSDEEDDYMSDAFLTKIPDTRPGLVSQSVAKRNEKEKKAKLLMQNRPKSRKQLESDNREEGLKNALSSDNKGFDMLKRMGFKPGMTLGKKGEGRAEPVPIEFKASRTGLGHDNEVRRKRSLAEAQRTATLMKRVKMQEQWQNDFRSRLTQKQSDKEAERDLYKSQRVCEQLDQQKDIEVPAKSFFWPPQEDVGGKEEDEEEEEEEEEEAEEETDEEAETLTVSEKLEMLTSYIREEHTYCVWCGTVYNDKEDMEANCPGPSAADHDE